MQFFSGTHSSLYITDNEALSSPLAFHTDGKGTPLHQYEAQVNIITDSKYTSSC